MADNKVYALWKEIFAKTNWLGFNSLLFDCSYVMCVHNSRGYIAHSPSRECFFMINPIDSSDTEIIEEKFAYMDAKFIGPNTAVTVVDANTLFHFDIAQYANLNWYKPDVQTKVPYPRIPERSTIEGLEKDEATGLYPGTDEAMLLRGKLVSDVGTEINKLGFDKVKDGDVGMLTMELQKNHVEHKFVSAIGMFPQEDGEEQFVDPTNGAKNWRYSGANVEGWKKFYEIQKRFCTMLGEAYGISDAE